jgi:hypothetical protein
MHNSYFSTNENLLDQAVNSYWRRRDGVIAARKAAAKAKEDEAGTPFEMTEEEAQRFEDKVERGSGDDCDLWVAGKFLDGYGRFKLRGKSKRAHIVSWQNANGRLANPSRSMVIAHICETESCVKPSHLDEQTQQQNMLYADSSLPAILRARTHCPKGHELIEGNCKPTQWAQGHRVCQVCHLAKIRKLNALTKAAREALGITQVEYTRLYGEGRAAAIAIANDPGCELEHRKKQAE